MCWMQHRQGWFCLQHSNRSSDYRHHGCLEVFVPRKASAIPSWLKFTKLESSHSEWWKLGRELLVVKASKRSLLRDRTARQPPGIHCVPMPLLTQEPPCSWVLLLVHAGMGCKLTHLASKAVVGWSRHWVRKVSLVASSSFLGHITTNAMV